MLSGWDTKQCSMPVMQRHQSLTIHCGRNAQACRARFDGLIWRADPPHQVAPSTQPQPVAAELTAPALDADAAGIAAPWMWLDSGGRIAWAAQAIAGSVGKILGRQLAGHEPFMSAGLDSLGRPWLTVMIATKSSGGARMGAHTMYGLELP